MQPFNEFNIIHNYIKLFLMLIVTLSYIEWFFNWKHKDFQDFLENWCRKETATMTVIKSAGRTI